LLGPLLERLPEVFAKVLACLDASDTAALAQVGTPWLAAVVHEGVARAGKRGNPPLRLSKYLGSITRLAWAKQNGCPWKEHTCALIAKGAAPLEVLQWARDNGLPWDDWTCMLAAKAGRLEAGTTSNLYISDHSSSDRKQNILFCVKCRRTRKQMSPATFIDTRFEPSCLE